MREFIVSEDFHPEVQGYAELVRCKDCKHYDSDTQSCLDGLNGIFQPDWFCADGLRKDGDDDGIPNG